MYNIHSNLLLNTNGTSEKWYFKCQTDLLLLGIENDAPPPPPNGDTVCQSLIELRFWDADCHLRLN